MSFLFFILNKKTNSKGIFLKKKNFSCQKSMGYGLVESLSAEVFLSQSQSKNGNSGLKKTNLRNLNLKKYRKISTENGLSSKINQKISFFPFNKELQPSFRNQKNLSFFSRGKMGNLGLLLLPCFSTQKQGGRRKKLSDRKARTKETIQKFSQTLPNFGYHVQKYGLNLLQESKKQRFDLPSPVDG